MGRLVVAMSIVLILAVSGLAQEQTKADARRKCTKDCGWYEWNYQNIRNSLDSSIASGSKYANYNLELLEVDLGIDILCVRKICAGYKKKRIERNHRHIMKIICPPKLKSAKPKPKKIESPPIIIDDFSDLIKK